MAAPVTFTSSGTYTVPSNCTAIQIECWGGGGPGGTGGSMYSGMNAGGGGGGYARKNSFSVTPGQTYTVVVGGQSGTSTFNSTTCSATGGDGGNYVNNGGPGGYGTNGDVLYTGGKGGISGGFAGGGGGSSAGPSNNGNNGGTSGGGAAVSGGGAGGNGCTYSGGNGDAGSAPGGGGGGGWQAYSWGTGGAGASGKVVVTEVTSVPIVTTQAAYPIDPNTIQGNGTITDTGTTTVTRRGFVYKINNSLTGVRVLAAGGGGSGGYCTRVSGDGGNGGGGGAGEFAYITNYSIGIGTHSVTVGTGGISTSSSASNGGDTIFSSITAKGGGYGGVASNGANGGCGGGGSGFYGSAVDSPSGGGGGAGGIGINGHGGSKITNGGIPNGIYTGNVGGDGYSGGGTYYAGNGGDGISNSISGTPVLYCAGGGGASYINNGKGLGGAGGGGTGTDRNHTTPGNGTGIGCGGGGGNVWTSWGSGGNGSDGIVIISYPTSSGTATGGTVTTDGAYTVHTFTSNDTFTVTSTTEPSLSDSQDVHEDGTFSTGAYSLNITSLQALTQYQVRAYATNSNGTSYGSTVTIATTNSLTPSVNTNTSVTHIKSLDLNGEIVYQVGSSIQRGFLYKQASSGTPVRPTVKVFISAGDSTGGTAFVVPIGAYQTVGGGTGGSYQYNSSYTLWGTSFPVTIGNGGTGNNSVFDQLTALGGGAATSNGNVVISYDPAKFGSCTGGTIIEPNATQTYTYTSNGSWTCPDGVTSVVVECLGGGGNTGIRNTNYGNGGAGGGGYARSTVSVTPGTTYSFTVAGSAQNTQFNSNQVVGYAGGSVADNTGTHGAGGSGIGDVVYTGGNGADGTGTGSGYSGGGGEGAESTANGHNASGTTGGTGGTGGDGGAGRTSSGNAVGGGNYGGGAGGAYRSSGSRSGASGGTGWLKLTYSSSERSHTFTSNGTFTVVGAVDSDSYVSTSGTFDVGTFTETIRGLTPSTDYRIRAFAQNGAGTGYGSTITSTTLAQQTGSGLMMMLLNNK